MSHFQRHPAIDLSKQRQHVSFDIQVNMFLFELSFIHRNL